MSRHFTVRQNCLVPHKQQIKRNAEMIKAGSGIRFVLCRCYGERTGAGSCQQSANIFNCAFKNSPSADRTSCVDWPRKMSNQRQHMLTELQFLPLADVECSPELLMVIAQLLLITDRHQITLVTLIPIQYSQWHSARKLDINQLFLALGLCFTRSNYHNNCNWFL